MARDPHHCILYLFVLARTACNETDRVPLRAKRGHMSLRKPTSISGVGGYSPSLGMLAVRLASLKIGRHFRPVQNDGRMIAYGRDLSVWQHELAKHFGKSCNIIGIVVVQITVKLTISNP